MAKKVEQAGPKVLCAFDEMVAIDELQPNPRNPNTHSAEQTRLLAKLIGYHGWRVPVTVSNQTGFIVRGHGRYEAAKLMGLSTVPVDYQDYENEADEWADLVADNRIAELAVTDTAMLKDILEELNNGAFDMEWSGYTEDVIERMMTAIHKPEPLPPVSMEGWGEMNARIIVVFDGALEVADFWKALGFDEAPGVDGQVVFPWSELVEP